MITGAVGVIATSGVVVLNGVVLVSSFNQLCKAPDDAQKAIVIGGILSSPFLMLVVLPAVYWTVERRSR